MQAYEDQVSLVRVAQNQVEACEDELASRGAEIDALRVRLASNLPIDMQLPVWTYSGTLWTMAHLECTTVQDGCKDDIFALYRSRMSSL